MTRGILGEASNSPEKFPIPELAREVIKSKPLRDLSRTARALRAESSRDLTGIRQSRRGEERSEAVEFCPRAAYA